MALLQIGMGRVAGAASEAVQADAGGQFAVQARETIKSEAKRLSLMSSIAIWLVLFWVYRSFKLLALGLIPVLSGTLAGIAMVPQGSMNSLNPSVLFFWIGVAGTWSIQNAEGNHTALFYSSALATVFCTDLLKAWGACSLKKAVSSNFLIWMNRISGIILIGFGIAMIIKFMYIK